MGFRRHQEIHPRLPAGTTAPTNRSQSGWSYPQDSARPDDKVTQSVLDCTQQLRDHSYTSHGRNMHRQQEMAHNMRMALWHIHIPEDLCSTQYQPVPQVFPIYRQPGHPWARFIGIRHRRTMNLADKKERCLFTNFHSHGWKDSQTLAQFQLRLHYTSCDSWYFQSIYL